MGLNSEMLGQLHRPKREFPWPREKDKDVAIIPQTVLQPLIKEDIQYAVNRGNISEARMDAFIKDHVTGYMVDGVRVLLVNHEFDKPMEGIRYGELHDGARLIINSDTTHAVGIEYFMPELRRNAKRVPIIGENFIAEEERYPRLIFAKNVARQVENSQKKLFLADHGNRASMLFSYFVPPGLAAAEVFTVVLGLALKLPVPEIMRNIPLIIAAATYGLVMTRAREASKDREKIHPFLQRFGLTVDDARRVFVAAGIKQMVRDIKKNDPDGIKDRQLVVVYPKAHTMTIGDYLQHPHKIKRFLYRLRVDIPHRTRVYTVDGDTKGINKGDKFDGWKRISNRRIPLFA